MTQLLKQSTAVDVLIGPFLDKTDAATAETGESPSVKLSKNGQALAAKSDVTTPVHDADGYYNCELDATDTNTLGTMVLTVASSANALAVRHEFMVIPANAYDALVGGSDTLNAAVTEWNGVALATTNPLPNAAADAAGGLPISDAGGLDLDGRLDAAVSSRLAPTVASRTLDVTATGEAGLDFDNTSGTLAAAQIAANAIGASQLAADAATEIRDAVTGGAYALDTDANGRVRVVDGTGAGEINTASGVVEANMVQISGDATAADNLEESATAIVATTVNDASATTTSFVISSSEATNDHFNGRIIVFTSGALANQATDITAYAGATKTVTVTALTEAPGNGDAFVIV